MSPLETGKLRPPTQARHRSLALFLVRLLSEPQARPSWRLPAPTPLAANLVLKLGHATIADAAWLAAADLAFEFGLVLELGAGPLVGEVSSCQPRKASQSSAPALASSRVSAEIEPLTVNSRADAAGTPSRCSRCRCGPHRSPHRHQARRHIDDAIRRSQIIWSIVATNSSSDCARSALYCGMWTRPCATTAFARLPRRASARLIRPTRRDRSLHRLPGAVRPLHHLGRHRLLRLRREVSGSGV